MVLYSSRPRASNNLAILQGISLKSALLLLCRHGHGTISCLCDAFFSAVVAAVERGSRTVATCRPHERMRSYDYSAGL
jgi:hypothetical protein